MLASFGTHKDMKKKMFLPCHTGQKLDPDTELQFCYRVVSKMTGLHAGVRILASALLARTELCWLWAIVATVSYRTAS